MRAPASPSLLLTLVLMGLLMAVLQRAEAQHPAYPLKEGVYTSAYTFVNGRPLPGINVRVSDRNRKDFKVTDLRVLSSAKIKQRDFYQRMWGFYDGDALYISTTAFMPDASHIRYCKVLYLGQRLSYFEASRDLYETTGGAVEGIAGFITFTKFYFLLNMETGDILKLDHSLLETLLAEEDDLWYDYLDKEKNEENLLQYVRRLDERMQEY